MIVRPAITLIGDAAIANAGDTSSVVESRSYRWTINDDWGKFAARDEVHNRRISINDSMELAICGCGWCTVGERVSSSGE